MLSLILIEQCVNFGFSLLYTRSTLSLSYLTLLSYTPKNSGCLAHHILTTYSSADLPVGSGTPLRKLRIVSSWLFIKWRNERTSDWKKKKFIYICIHMYVFIYQDNSFTICREMVVANKGNSHVCRFSPDLIFFFFFGTRRGILSSIDLICP